VTVRATFKQLPPPPFFATCDLCGAVVDPSDRGRSAHVEHHEWITGIEIAARALLNAIQGPDLDLTREEKRSSSEGAAPRRARPRGSS
jgi:hypothetical protein